MKTPAPKRPVERPGAAAVLFDPRTRDAIRPRTGRDLRLILAGAELLALKAEKGNSLN